MNRAATVQSAIDDQVVLNILDSMNQLDPEKLEQWIQEPRDEFDSLEESLVQGGIVNEKQIVAAYADYYLMPIFDPPGDTPPPVDPNIAGLLPEGLCRENKIAPLADDGKTLEVAVFAPDSLLLADEIKLLTGRQMRPMFATLSVIDRLLDDLYDGLSTKTSLPTTPESSHQGRSIAPNHPTSVNLRGVGQQPNSQSTQQVDARLKRLLSSAMERRASDIHLETYESTCRIRMRVDGILSESETLNFTDYRSLVSRLKSLAGVESVNESTCQTGSFEINARKKSIEIRVRTCPTRFGETVALRVINPHAAPQTLDSIGLDRKQLELLNDALVSGRGMILNSGPSGCGKTSTHYATLRSLDQSALNIFSIESQALGKLSGINQIIGQPNAEPGFPKIIDEAVELDADVILVDELYDQRTATAAFRAALSGKLVLSSLTGNDVIHSLLRLSSMDIERLVLSTGLRCIMSQRLVRRLCPNCKEPYLLDADAAKRHGIPQETSIYRPTGCKSCDQTGYTGRFAIFETLSISSDLRDLLSRRTNRAALERAVQQSGFVPLRQTAIAQVALGETSMNEVLTKVAF